MQAIFLTQEEHFFSLPAKIKAWHLFPLHRPMPNCATNNVRMSHMRSLCAFSPRDDKGTFFFGEGIEIARNEGSGGKVCQKELHNKALKAHWVLITFKFERISHKRCAAEGQNVLPNQKKSARSFRASFFQLGRTAEGDFAATNLAPQSSSYICPEHILLGFAVQSLYYWPISPQSSLACKSFRAS